MIALAVPAAYASLTSTSFGFPTMIQSMNSTVFNQAIGTQWDLENANVSPFGSSTFGFPFLTTSASQGKAIEATDFSQTTVISAFSNPSLTTGVDGFGDFTGLSGFSSFL